VHTAVWEEFTVVGGTDTVQKPPVAWLMVKYGAQDWYHKRPLPSNACDERRKQIMDADRTNRVNEWLGRSVNMGAS
jgi:hypothetical protein